MSRLYPSVGLRRFRPIFSTWGSKHWTSSRNTTPAIPYIISSVCFLFCFFSLYFCYCALLNSAEKSRSGGRRWCGKCYSSPVWYLPLYDVLTYVCKVLSPSNTFHLYVALFRSNYISFNQVWNNCYSCKCIVKMTEAFEKLEWFFFEADGSSYWLTFRSTWWGRSLPPEVGRQDPRSMPSVYRIISVSNWLLIPTRSG